MSWLSRFTTLVLVTLASVCAGVSAPARAWDAETAHRGFAAAIELAATEIAALTASHVREKSRSVREFTSGRPNTAYAQVIEEVEQQGSGALSVKALYAVGDDRVRRYTPAVAGSGGNPGVPAGLRYYHADGLGSTRLLTDETGGVTDKTTFEAFGEIDAVASQQTSDNAFLYTGEQLV